MSELKKLKRPTKPHDVKDIWDYKVIEADYREKLEKAEEWESEFKRRIAELESMLSQLEDLRNSVAEWKQFTGDIDSNYMDYDDALNTLLSFRQRNQLTLSDSRIPKDDPECFRFESDGRFDVVLILKAVRSTGGKYEPRIKKDGWGIIWLRPEIKTWILEQDHE